MSQQSRTSIDPCPSLADCRRVVTEHCHKHSNLFECNSIRMINWGWRWGWGHWPEEAIERRCFVDHSSLLLNWPRWFPRWTEISLGIWLANRMYFDVSRPAATWQRTMTMDSLKLSSPIWMLQSRKKCSACEKCQWWFVSLDWNWTGKFGERMTRYFSSEQNPLRDQSNDDENEPIPR